jgi:hypothetical protein
MYSEFFINCVLEVRMLLRKNRFSGIIICILATMVIGFSCRLPDINEKQLPAKPIEIYTPTILPTTVLPQTTTNELPTLLPKEPQPLSNEFQVAFNGISFMLDKNLGQNVTTETIPAVTDPNNAAPWDLAPQYDHIKIEHYPLQNTFHEPQVYIYPTSGFAEINQGAQKEIDNLKAMLADKPTGPFKEIPFLPSWNAAQQLRAQVIYLDFQNGSGIRFISQYAQAPVPINNKEIFYTFQGLTDDGKYYISIILPINHPLLPATGDLTQDEFQKLADNFPKYMDNIEKELGSSNPNSFIPNLSLLDNLVKSVSVGK